MNQMILKRFSISYKRNPFLAKVSKNLVPHQEKLFKHELYAKIKNQDETRIFMSNHIYAVWDFMSLLKTLQRHFTCVNIPWIPKQSPELCHFINEIVLGEECDNLGTHDAGQAISHYELYLKAMDEVKADKSGIEHLLKLQMDGYSWRKAIKENKNQFCTNGSIISDVTLDFVEKTLNLCEKAPPHVIASCFLYGREDPIPKMFQNILNNLEEKNIFCPNLKLYLARHIEVDSGSHSILAEKMIVNICGDDQEKWDEAEEFAIKSINERARLWDGIMEKIYVVKKKALPS